MAAAERSRFFLIAAIVAGILVFAGFLPSFFLRAYFRDASLAPYLIVHGLVMSVWLMLGIAQPVLIARRQFAWHRWLGWAGAGLAVAVVIAGIVATLRQPAAYAGRQLPFPMDEMVIGNLFGFALFAGFVTAAIILRRRAAWHKRLIYWAMVVTVGPALTPGRSLGAALLPYFPRSFPPELCWVWLAWIALLIEDWRTRRAFHPASVAGGFVLLFVGFAVVDWLLMLDPVRSWVRDLA